MGMLCSIWSADILIMASPYDPYVSIWLPQPVHSWMYKEEANQAVQHLPVSSTIDAVINDVLLPLTYQPYMPLQVVSVLCPTRVFSSKFLYSDILVIYFIWF